MSTTKHQFLAIGPYAWGKGETAKEAFTNAKRNLPGSSTYLGKDPIIIVYLTGPGAYVSDMGGINYPKDEPAPIKVATFGVRGNLRE